ncbi:MAG: MopE-related protein [Polyangiaceae bacterium]
MQNTQPGAETCNGVDDDCNGAVDNGANACGGACVLGSAPGGGCDGNDADLCNEGTWQCSGLNAVVCSDATANNQETCNGVDDDCDGSVDEGTNACGGVCVLAHAPGGACDGADTDVCNEGSWQCSGTNNTVCSDGTGNNVEICDAIDQDCDGNISEGPCTLTNASSTCTNGACTITTCNAGFANCDSNQGNGCEVQSGGASNVAPGENLGSWNADSSSGFPFCSGDGCDALLTRTGTRGKFFNIGAIEDSDCSAYISLRFDLDVPAGVDYDLYITGTACFADPAFSQTGAGDKSIVVWCSDVSGDDDSFTANVEVRYASGSSCTPWTLSVYRHEC